MVDKDTDGRDDKASVQALDAVRLKGLRVDVQETIKLALSALALGVIGQPGPGKVKGVDKEERHGSSAASGGDVGGELLPLGGSFGGGKNAFDGVLEGEVKSLGGGVSEDISEISSPEAEKSFRLHSPLGAVKNAIVWPVQDALFEHLGLVLDQQFYSLDGGSSCLGDTGSNTRQHEVLEESQLFFAATHLDWRSDCLVSCRSESSNISLVVLQETRQSLLQSRWVA